MGAGASRCSFGLAFAAIGYADAQSLKVDWENGVPSVDLPHLEDGESFSVRRTAVEDMRPVDDARLPNEDDDVYDAYDEADEMEDDTMYSLDDARETITVSPTMGQEEESGDELPRGSLRATLRRLSVRLPASDDAQSLRDALDAALRTAKMPLLRGLLLERGGSCVGCSERHEFVRAVYASLRKPLVGRHALPLFLYNTPLFPHSSMGLNLFEPRYKLLCRKVLKADRVFGFVSSDGVGTLAKITAFRFGDDDPRDGTCEMTISGLRRFTLGRQWQDKCDGCTSGPLHFADVSYFGDRNESDERPQVMNGKAKPRDAAALVKESLRLYYSSTTRELQRDLEQAHRLGPTPTSAKQSERSYAMSMWLAAACVQLHEGCKAQAATLLATRSTTERLERVLKVQRSEMGKKYDRRG